MRMRMLRWAACLLAALSLAGQQSATNAPPALAAATVKWVCTGFCRQIPSAHPAAIEPTRLSCDTCLPLGLVLMAYGLKLQGQVTNNPDWMSWDRYHIEIASSAPVSRTQMQQVLLRRVLTQCFALRAREATRSVPGFALVVAPGGIKFEAAATQPPFRVKDGIETLSSLPQLAEVLTQYYYDGKLFGVTRPVHDATGLSGYFSIRFPMSPDDPDTNLLAGLTSLGLRVKSDPGTETTLQIQHMEHLTASCTLGPDAPGPAKW